MADMTSYFILPFSPGSHSFVFSVSNSSGLVCQHNVVYNVSDTGVMSGTGVRKRLAADSDFSVDGGINYTCSTTGITIVWADSMSRITIPYFQIYCPDGYTVGSFLFDDSPLNFSMSTPVNLFDGRSVPSAPIMEITPIDLSDLGGNFSKYVQGDRVFYGTYGIWEVLKSTLMLVSEDTFMPMYQLRQNIADDGKPVKYRYNVAPQNVLTLYVPPKSLTVGG